MTVTDPAKFRACLDAMIEQFPELFPAEITIKRNRKQVSKVRLNDLTDFDIMTTGYKTS